MMTLGVAELTGLLVGAVLLMGTLPLVRRVAARDGAAIGRIFAVGLIAKFLAVPAQFFVVATFYGNMADFNKYHRAGVEIASQLRVGIVSFGDDRIIGTRFIEILTGTIYTLIGDSRLGAFFVFSWLAYCGFYFLYRALRIGVPDADAKRYAIMLFCVPSLLFWTSSIGKDAWMLFALGLTSLGMAKLTRHERGGFLALFLGLAAAGLVRPHVALMLLAPLPICYLLRRSPRRTAFTPVAKVAGLALFGLLGVLGAQVAADFFHVDDLSAENISGILEKTENSSTGLRADGSERNSGRYGSTFDAPDRNSPWGYALGIFTVLFRPLPFEANNTTALVSSLESIVLLAVAVLCRRRIRSGWRAMRAKPFVLFVVLYFLLFTYLFASISNFGILSRQRVQLLPFFFVLLALQPAGSSPASPDAGGRAPVAAAGSRAVRPQRAGQVQPVDAQTLM